MGRKGCDRLIQVSQRSFLSDWLDLSNLCKGMLVRLGASCRMPNALLARATRAIDESRALREQHRQAMRRHDEALNDLRLAILDSAMLRSEIKARRDNEEP